MTSIDNGCGLVKTRSLLRKSCKNSWGHSFVPIFLKLALNVSLDKLKTPIENRCGWVKNLVARLNLRKILITFKGCKNFLNLPET